MAHKIIALTTELRERGKHFTATSYLKRKLENVGKKNDGGMNVRGTPGLARFCASARVQLFICRSANVQVQKCNCAGAGVQVCICRSARVQAQECRCASAEVQVCICRSAAVQVKGCRCASAGMQMRKCTSATAQVQESRCAFAGV